MKKIEMFVNGAWVTPGWDVEQVGSSNRFVVYPEQIPGDTSGDQLIARYARIRFRLGSLVCDYPKVTGKSGSFRLNLAFHEPDSNKFGVL